jgi:hypothetical protein
LKFAQSVNEFRMRIQCGSEVQTALVN